MSDMDCRCDEKDFPNFLSDFFRAREDNRIVEKDKDLSIAARKEGNKLYASKEHDDNKHREMLLLYCKSIMLAPNDSEELGLGYGNRSALLLHFQKTRQADADIDRALKLIQSEETKTKLLLRKQECKMDISAQDEEWPLLSKQEKLLNYNVKYELPKIKAFEKIPCLADCVSLVYNEENGKHMVATRDINAGEIICAEEGYVTYPLSHQTYLVCSHCLDFVWDGVPCETCACVLFCSAKCKNEAWKEYHDVECLILPELNHRNHYGNVEMIQNVAATRLFIKAVKKEGLEKILQDVRDIDENKDTGIEKLFENGILSSKSFKTFYGLNYFQEDVFKLTDEVNYICPIIFNLLKSRTKLFEGSEETDDFSSSITNLLKRVINIFVANTAKFQGINCMCKNPVVCHTSCKNNRGLIVNPVTNLFKHSCIPNVGKLYSSKKKVILFSLQPIKKGEQLHMSSGPIFTVCSKEERKEILLDNFHQTCDCQACSEDWVLNPTSKEIIAALDEGNNLKDAELSKYVRENNLTSQMMNDVRSKLYNNHTLKYSLKMIKLIYEKHGNSYVAYLLCRFYKDYIENSYDMLYGIDYEIPNNTAEC